ncbi:hypothetical protein LCGC14_1333920, partial [marine sediment metagenome]
IDHIINTLGGPGNQRVIELGINKGTLNIDGENDKIFFEIESKYTYSQPGEDVSVGNIIARTEEKGNINELTLTIDYGGGYDITFQNQDELKKISKASTPYKVIIKNMGEDAFKKTIDRDWNHDEFVKKMPNSIFFNLEERLNRIEDLLKKK